MKTKDFLAAVKNGDESTVRGMLLEDPGLAASRDENDVSALLLSVFHRQPAITPILLSASPPVDPFEAATIGDLDRVRAHVEGSADRAALLGSFTGQGFNALGLAAFFGHGEVVEYLLDSGASIDATDRSGNANTPLDAAVSGDHTDVALRLLERGASADVTDAAGHTPLHKAAHHGNRTLVERLLDAGAPIDAVSGAGKTPLMMAAEQGHEGVVELLRSRGAR